MSSEEYVTYEYIADRLDYHEVLVRRMWDMLRLFKRDCRQVFRISGIKTRRCLGSAGPLEVEFYFRAAADVPPLLMVAAIIDAQFEFLEFATAYSTFAWCRDPDSDEFTQHGFQLRIAYWRFSQN